MKYVFTIVFSSILFLGQTAMANQIVLEVKSKTQMVKHLRLLQVVSSSDTVVLEVKHRPEYNKAVICRYVDALKNTKARVRFGNVPREVIRHARGC